LVFGFHENREPWKEWDQDGVNLGCLFESFRENVELLPHRATIYGSPDSEISPTLRS